MCKVTRATYVVAMRCFEDGVMVFFGNEFVDAATILRSFIFQIL